MSDIRLYRVMRDLEGNHCGNEYLGRLVVCGECENWQADWTPEAGVDNYHYCAMVDRSTFADWYCADGERKESEDA